jgi:hypothetical protein
VGVADETTSKEEEEDDVGVGETESEDEVEETFGTVEDIEDDDNGIR